MSLRFFFNEYSIVIREVPKFKKLTSKKKKPMLVVLAGLAPFMNNKALDREFMSQFHGGQALTDMAEAILNAGFEIMTIDLYLQTCPQRKALLVSDMGLGLSSKNANIIPAICYSLESPIVATRYYHHIQDRTRSFVKVYDWAGVAQRVDNAKRRFIPISWPTTTGEIMTTIPWPEKKFLVMINSNKRSLQWAWPEFKFHKLSQFPRSLFSNLNTTWIKFIDPFMKSEIYVQRLNAIKFFSNDESFDLFGGGWDKKLIGTNDEVQFSVKKCYRGTIPDNAKLEYLHRYKFSIIFENTIFPGYLTEKIFDCFFAGVIPIYLGEPNVEKRIPPDCFIDARKFLNYEQLNTHLHSMTEEMGKKYLDAARRFVDSRSFEPFTSKHFANTIVQCLNEISPLNEK